MTYKILAASILASATLGAIAACSGSSTSSIAQTGNDGGAADGSAADTGSGISTTEASNDVATALCTRFEACAPGYITLAYGTSAECAKRLGSSVAIGIGAPGSIETPDQLEACAAAAPNISCADLVGRNLPAACLAPAGALANGTACAGDSQCLNKRCKVAAGAVCGSCAALATAGGGCGVDDDCVNGAKCENSVCTAYGASGDACDDTRVCNPTLGCVNKTCGPAGATGTACKESAECDQLHGVFCNGAQCATLAFTSPPSACGLVGGALTLCTGPASCVGLGAGTGMGTCDPAPADGTPCNADGGAACESPAVCVSGTCTIVDPKTCSDNG